MRRFLFYVPNVALFLHQSSFCFMAAYVFIHLKPRITSTWKKETYL